MELLNSNDILTDSDLKKVFHYSTQRVTKDSYLRKINTIETQQVIQYHFLSKMMSRNIGLKGSNHKQGLCVFLQLSKQTRPLKAHQVKTFRIYQNCSRCSRPPPFE